jgi:adenine phosphoribosyltransferase
MMIEGTINQVSDWPLSGLNFKDLTTVLVEPDKFRWTIDQLKNFMSANNVDCIAAPGADGFIWGAPVALELMLPFHMLRKPGQLPPPVLNQNYEHDHGGLIVKGDIKVGPGTRVGIIDDVNAGGRTAIASIELLKQFGVNPQDIFYACVVDLPFLNGSKKIKESGVTMISLVDYNE